MKPKGKFDLEFQTCVNTLLMDTDLKTPIQQCFCAAALLKINGYPGPPLNTGQILVQRNNCVNFYFLKTCV